MNIIKGFGLSEVLEFGLVRVHFARMWSCSWGNGFVQVIGCSVK